MARRQANPKPGRRTMMAKTRKNATQTAKAKTYDAGRETAA
jgi:hypothetical protein